VVTPTMGRTACTEPQCLYKGALYVTFIPIDHCILKNVSYRWKNCYGSSLPFVFNCTLLGMWLKWPECGADLIGEVHCVLYGRCPKYAYS